MDANCVVWTTRTEIVRYQQPTGGRNLAGRRPRLPTSYRLAGAYPVGLATMMTRFGESAGGAVVTPYRAASST